MKLITVIITEEGDQLLLNGHGAEVFCDAGPSVVRRASHVEPNALALRILFRAIRAIVRDTSAIAQWTRTWRCLWRVAIVGGPVLPDRYTDRETAIEAETSFLNDFFLERK